MSDPRTAHGFRTHVSEQRYTVVRQPIMDLATQKIRHHEWLVRFDDDEHLEDLLRPAEISGAIMDLDLSMLKQAIIALNKHPKSTGIAVNLSGASLDEASIETKLFPLLDELLAPPEKLIIELTETWDMRTLDNAIRILEHVKRLGHPVCLDDVGAGAASIRYLRALPADWLKIDGAFVVAAMSSSREFAILKAILSLRNALSVKVIAEGVETPEILNFVSELEFDAAQGYAIGIPEEETRIY